MCLSKPGRRAPTSPWTSASLRAVPRELPAIDHVHVRALANPDGSAVVPRIDAQRPHRGEKAQELLLAPGHAAAAGAAHLARATDAVVSEAEQAMAQPVPLGGRASSQRDRRTLLIFFSGDCAAPIETQCRRFGSSRKRDTVQRVTSSSGSSPTAGVSGNARFVM